MSDSSLPAAVAALRRLREDPHRLGHSGHGEGPAEGIGSGGTGPANSNPPCGSAFAPGFVCCISRNSSQCFGRLKKLTA